MDDFNSLSQRLLSRCPQVGIVLAQQLVNDAWRTLQARKEWSWRRRGNTFAPPNLYQTGSASTNVAAGAPTLITGIGTTWTPSMIGQQIRIGGLLYPYYTIVGWLSATSLLIDQPWAGADVVSQPYQILQCFYPMPQDFGYFYVATSIKDSYRLFTDCTQAELAVMDPQRTNQGQTYAVVYKDFTPVFGGIIGPVIPINNPASNTPISTTATGYTYVSNASYIIQVVAGGFTGTATFQWLRAGMTSFQPIQGTSDQAQDLMDGVQIYWPDGQNYNANDLFTINCQSMVTESVPRYELWPAPTFNGYLYPYIYMAKEQDLTKQNPSLPPPMASRGEVILEMSLEKCATFPGPDIDHPNPYFNLALANMHRSRYEDMLIDLMANDENIGVNNIDYQTWPFLGPWGDGRYQQSHAPMLWG